MKKQFREMGASVACKWLAAFRISVIVCHFLIKNTENRSYNEKNESMKKSRFSLFFQFENIASLFFFCLSDCCDQKVFFQEYQNILKLQKFLWAQLFTKRTWNSPSRKPTPDQSFVSLLGISFLLGSESRPWKFGFWMVNRPQSLY